VGSTEVAQAVKEVSQGAEDPQHVASVVGAFMQVQPMVGHYVTSHSGELGLEGVVLTLLHASVLARAIELSAGRKLRAAKAPDLDVAARPGRDAAAFEEAEPHLHSYLTENIADGDPTLGGKKRKIALGLLHVIAEALLRLAR
jgi:hypothetical protein